MLSARQELRRLCGGSDHPPQMLTSSLHLFLQQATLFYDKADFDLSKRPILIWDVPSVCHLSERPLIACRGFRVLELYVLLTAPCI